MKHITQVILLTFLSACFGQPPVKTGLEGKVIPSFTLLLSDSTTYINTSTIPNGQPIVLFYYSPRCPYCRAQMEEMIDNIKRLKNMRLYVITAWPFAEMKAFSNHYKLASYPNIVAGADVSHFFEPYFSLSGVPFTAIYGKDKKLKEAIMGKTDSKEIKEAVED